MNERTLLGRKAMRGALDVRKRAGSSFNDPVCVYDIAEQLGVSVWFQGGGSFGGMYSKTANAILVPSLRPAPRQAYTCAHEIGHWYYDHGSKLDAYDESYSCDSNDEEELLADLFAGHLLMPSGAVTLAFKTRGLTPNTCSGIDFFRVTSQLGVGYTTLLNHMLWTQQSLSRANFDRLSRHTPKSLRNTLLGSMAKDPGHLVMTDEQWNSVPIDMQVGQAALLPLNVSPQGSSVEVIKEVPEGVVVCAVAPGISKAENNTGSWASFIRVSRTDFQGRSLYRHLEEAEDE